MLGVTSERLSQELGVTVQQLGRYEDGSLRIGATLLLKIATYLNTPPSFFFEGLSHRSSKQSADRQGHDLQVELLPVEGLELIRIMLSVKDAAARKKIIDYAASLADPDAPATKKVVAPN